MAASFARHDTVNHGLEEYAHHEKIDGEEYVIHTNTVEGYYSIFKRGMKGVYQHCSEKHLHRYLAEFDFRYNNRAAFGVNDLMRAEDRGEWHRWQAPDLSTASQSRSITSTLSVRRGTSCAGGKTMVAAEVYAGLGALKTAFDIAKGLKDIDNATSRNAAVIELQEKILSAQTEQADLVERVRELKKEVADLKAWDADKARYQLKNIQPGVTVYALKEGMENGELPHYLCPTCYQRGQRSILQKETLSVGKVVVQVCHECGTDLLEHGVRQEGMKPYRPRGR